MNKVIPEDIVYKRFWNRPLIEKLLEIVVDFIKQEQLLIYGGQAIDFSLKLKGDTLYDQYETPDYDVYSPDNYNTAVKFCQMMVSLGFEKISMMPALHPQTIRIRYDVYFILDISNATSRMWSIFQNYDIRYDGIKFRHPYFQYIDLLLVFCQPFAKAKVENIYYRWEKDWARLHKLGELYPIDAPKVKSELIARHCIPKKYSGLLAGLGAYAYYTRTLGNPLNFKDGEYDVYKGMFPDTFILENFCEIRKAPQLGQFYTPVADAIPLRFETMTSRYYSIGQEYYLQTQKSYTIQKTDYGDIVAVEFIIIEFLWMWLYASIIPNNGDPEFIKYLVKILLDGYLANEKNVELLPSIIIPGDPQNIIKKSDFNFYRQYKDFYSRQIPPALYFPVTGEIPKWIPDIIYQNDGTPIKTLDEDLDVEI